MKDVTQHDTDDFVLADELAGQLAHDLGNFVHNLVLHAELSRSRVAHQPNWDTIKE